MTTYCKLGLTIYIGAILLNGPVAGRQLPNDLQNKLVALQTDFEQQAVKADNLQKGAATDLERLGTIREIAAPRQATESDVGGTNLRMGFDGMAIFLQTFSVEAGLNRDSCRILEGVIGSILAGERYNKLDAALQQLETAQSGRDRAMKVLTQHFDQVVGVLQLARQDRLGSTTASALDATDAFIVSQRLSNGTLVNQYEEEIKPGTQALREIVDKLARSGG